MNPKATTEIDFHGKKVPARVYGDNFYLEVATKVELAHAGAAPEPGFSEVSHDFIKCGLNNEHEAIRIGIQYKGKTFYGTAQIKWGGRNVDAIDPVENAETSARGRALAAAGFEVGTMCSAEDMDRVMNGHRVVESEPLALPDPAAVLPDGLNWVEWSIRLGKTKGFTTKETWKAELARITGKPTSGTYTTEDYQKTVAYFVTLPDRMVSEQTNEQANV